MVLFEIRRLDSWPLESPASSPPTPPPPPPPPPSSSSFNNNALDSDNRWSMALCRLPHPPWMAIARPNSGILEIRHGPTNGFSEPVSAARLPTPAKAPLANVPAPVIGWGSDTATQDILVVCSHDSGNVHVLNHAGVTMFSFDAAGGDASTHHAASIPSIPRPSKLPSLASKFLAMLGWSHASSSSNDSVRAFHLAAISHKTAGLGSKWKYQLMTLSPQSGLNLHHLAPRASVDPHQYLGGVEISSVFSNVNDLAVVGDMLYVAGAAATAGKDNDAPCLASWRRTNEAPFFKLVEGSKTIVGKSGFGPIIQVLASRNKILLATLDARGTLGIWRLPGLKRILLLEASELSNRFETQDFNDQSQNFSADDLPRQIEWWSSSELLIMFNSGAIVVTQVSDSGLSENMLNPKNSRFRRGAIISPVSLFKTELSELSSNEKRKFYIIEREDRYVVKQMLADVVIKERLLAEGSKPPKQDVISFSQKIKDKLWNMLYNVTGNEGFCPVPTRVVEIQHSFTLSEFCSTTPLEMYQNFIGEENYGDALEFAQNHDLDSDLVYKARWRKEKITKHTVQYFLSKILDTDWVLNECLTKIPPDDNGTEAILSHGLKITDVSSSGGDSDVSHLKRQNRLMILRYLDRLKTFRAMCEWNETVFVGEEYGYFRSCDIIAYARECAQRGKLDALNVMFIRHGASLNPYRLDILSYIPENVDPGNYVRFLPKVDSDGKTLLPYAKNKPWRTEIDWAEKGLVDDQSKSIESDHNVDTIRKWYEDRVLAIDKYCGSVQLALKLIDLGQSSNVDGLERLHSQLVTLHTLVYECPSASLIALQDLQNMSHTELIFVFLGVTAPGEKDDDNYSLLKSLKNFVLPYIERIKNVDGSKTVNDALISYFAKESRNSLSKCLAVAKASSIELRKEERLVSDVALLIELSVDCIYSCDNPEEQKNMDEIYRVLPGKKDIDITKDKMLEIQYNRMVDLGNYLDANYILAKYEMSRPLKELEIIFSKSRGCQKNQQREEKDKVGSDLLIQLARQATRFDVVDPVLMLIDLVKLESFLCADSEATIACRLFVESMLASGKEEQFDIAREFLYGYKGPGENRNRAQKEIDQETNLLLSAELSEEVVLKAAREHFNGANDLSRSEMNLAERCLKMIDVKDWTAANSMAVKEELDLISAVEELHKFDVPIVPYQIRMTTDRMDIMKKVFQTSKGASASFPELISLGRLLGASHGDSPKDNALIYLTMGGCAIESGDHDRAVSILEKLMEGHHPAAWSFGRDVCLRCKSLSLILRQKALGFALKYAPAEELDGLLAMWERLDWIYHANSDKCDSLPFEEQDKFYEAVDHFSYSAEIVSPNKIELSKVFPMSHYHSLCNGGDIEVHGGILNSNMRQVARAIVGLGSDVYNAVKSRSGDGEGSSKLLSGEDNPVMLSCHLILRARLMKMMHNIRFNKTDTSVADVCDDVDDLLLSLACEISNSDSSAFISHLLAVCDVKKLTEFFSGDDIDLSTIEASCYVFSLLLLSYTKPLTRDIFMLPAPEVIKKGKALLENQDKSLRGPGRHIADALSDSLKKLTCGLLAIDLQDLGLELDIVKFACNGQYAISFLESKVCSEDDKIINIALKVSEQHSTDNWNIVKGYLKWIIESSQPMKAILTKLDAVNAARIIKTKGAIARAWIQENIYPSLGGLDHWKLGIYFSWLRDCSPQEAKAIDDHVKALASIRTLAPELNYKELIEGDDPVGCLSMVLNESNISVLTDICKRIPNPASPSEMLNPSTINCAFCLQSFEKGMDRARDSKNSNGWYRHYESYRKTFLKMDLSDLDIFCKACLVGKRGTMVDFEFRLHILRDMRKMLCGEGKKKPRSRLNEEHRAIFSEKIELFIKHLEIIKEEPFISLLHERSPRLYNYYLDHCTDMKMMEIFLKLLILEGFPLNFIKQAISLLEKDPRAVTISFDVEKSFWVVVNALIDSLRSGMEPSPVLSELFGVSVSDEDAFMNRVQDSVRNIILGVKEDNTEHKALVTSEEFSRVLEAFCADPDVPLDNRTPVLLALRESNLFDSKKSEMFNLFVETENIIHQVWTDVDLELHDVENDEGRKRVFEILMDSSKGIEDRLKNLFGILEVWGNAPTSSQGSFSAKLFENLVSLDERDISPFLEKKAFDTRRELFAMSKIQEVHAFNVLQSRHPLFAIRFGLSSSDVALHLQAIQKLNEIHKGSGDGVKVNEKVLGILDARGMYAGVVSTPYFPDLVSRLLERNDDRELEEAVSQLRENGNIAEAGYIIGNKRMIMPALRTFDLGLTLGLK